MSQKLDVATGELRPDADDPDFNLDEVSGSGFDLSRLISSNLDQRGAGSVSAGAVGLGAGVSGEVFARNTEAYVTSSMINAKKAVDIGAVAARKLITIVASGTLGAGAITGASAIDISQGDTRAYIKSTSIHTGDLNVTADYKADYFIAVGGAAVGSVGAAGSFSVGVDSSTVEAYVDSSTVMATGNAVVDAASEVRRQNWVISGAGGITAGVAGNAQVFISSITTRAYTKDSDFGTFGQRLDSLTVNANEKVMVKNRAGAIGVGMTGSGIGAGAGVTVLNNTTSALVDGSNVYTTADLKVLADAERDLDTIGVSAGLAAGLGLGGNLSLILIGSVLQDTTGDIRDELDKGGNGTLSNINNSVMSGLLSEDPEQGNVHTGEGITKDDLHRVNAAGKTDIKAALYSAPSNSGVSAMVTGASDLDAGADLTVTATTRDQIRIDSGAGGLAGIYGAGGAAGALIVKNSIQAQIGSGATAKAANNLRVEASSENLNPGKPAFDVRSYQGSAGLVSIGAAVSISHITNNISATAGGTLIGGSGELAVIAQDNTDIVTEAHGFQFGGGAAGVVVADAQRKGRTEARLSDYTKLNTTGPVRLDSSLAGDIKAYTVAGSGGASTLQGSIAVAVQGSTILSILGSNIVLDTAGALIIQAGAEFSAEAEAYGFSGSLLATVGGVAATAANELAINAGIGADNTITAANLDLSATSLDSLVKAGATGGGGSLVVGANATESRAINNSHVQASIGASEFNISGNMNVRAASGIQQEAVSTGVTLGGLLAMGENIARAEANPIATVMIQNGITGTIAGLLDIDAININQMYAYSVAGNGGTVSVNAATANVSNNSQTKINLGGGSGSEYLRVGSLSANAKHWLRFRSFVDSVNAGVLGASGARATDTINYVVETVIADNARIKAADSLDLGTSNTIEKPFTGDFDVKVGAGGVANDSAGVSLTTIAGRSTIKQGNSSIVESAGAVSYNIENDFLAWARARLDTGGGIEIARIEAKILAELIENEVILGENALLKAGTVKVGSRTLAELQTQAIGKTFGYAGAASGSSLSRMNVNNVVDIGTYATIEVEEDLNIAVGRNVEKSANSLLVTAYTDLYNKTTLPMETDPEAVAEAHQTNFLLIRNEARLHSLKHISLLADEGYQRVSARGTGRDLYRDVLEGIVNAFRRLFELGEISILIETGTTDSKADNRIMVDGLVRAGLRSNEQLIIDPYREVEEQTPGLEFEIIDGYIDVKDAYLSGGSIYVNTDNLYGTGQLVAPGDITATVTNKSDLHLRIHDLIIDSVNTGYLYYNGVAVSSAEDIADMNHSQSLGVSFTVDAPGDLSEPLIEIKNTLVPVDDTSGPRIDLTGQLINRAGTIKIANAKGDIRLISYEGSEPFILGGTINMSAGGNIIQEWAAGIANPLRHPLHVWNALISNWQDFAHNPDNYNRRAPYSFE